MGWKEVAARLGTQGTVVELAELLALHHDIGRGKARRHARRLTGARPSKKLMRATKNLGWEEGAEGVAAAVATAGIAKVASFIGEKVKGKLGRPEDGRASRGGGSRSVNRQRQCLG
jgi:hypothetical protein